MTGDEFAPKTHFLVEIAQSSGGTFEGGGIPTKQTIACIHIFEDYSLLGWENDLFEKCEACIAFEEAHAGVPTKDGIPTNPVFVDTHDDTVVRTPFDDYGKKIISELDPYLEGSPLVITKLRKSIGQMSVTRVKCKTCGYEQDFTVFAYDNPYLWLLSAERAFSHHHSDVGIQRNKEIKNRIINLKHELVGKLYIRYTQLVSRETELYMESAVEGVDKMIIQILGELGL